MSISRERCYKSFANSTSISPSDIRYMLNISDYGLGYRFMENLSQSKDKIHQVDSMFGVTETGGTLRIRAIKVACEMKARGIKENDIVVICSVSHSEQTVAILATLFLGGIVAPLDVDLAIVDFKACIVALKPKIAFCDIRVSGILEVIYRTTSDITVCPIVVFGDHMDRFAFERFLLKMPDPEFRAVKIEDTKRAVAFIIPTQGTSGSPKMVCISHRAIFVQIVLYGEIMLKGVEKIVSFFPLSWIMQIVIICYCLEAKAVRIIPRTFKERSAFRLIHDLNIDCAFLGTEYAQRMMNHCSMEDYDISCLKLIYVGGIMTTALDMTLLRRAFITAKVIQCYGLTEMTGLVSALEHDDYSRALQNPGTAGKLMPYIKAKIMDATTKQITNMDSSGELLLSGPTLMLGYFKDIAGTEAAFEKNYYKTGEFAQFDSDGNLYILGRVSNHKIDNGDRFFPTEIEEMLRTHPKVQEAVVKFEKNEIIACIVRKNETLTVEELTSFIKSNLPISKQPTKIKFLPAIPKTPVGKEHSQLWTRNLKWTKLVYLADQDKLRFHIPSTEVPNISKVS